MDEISKKILNDIGIFLDDENEILIERELLLGQEKYENISKYMLDLRYHLSSSSLTSLQKNATEIQKWPLLNLVRQILNVYGYVMKPIRKCDGYTPDGIKKFKRFFLICKKSS
jgi:hypothetical protein